MTSEWPWARFLGFICVGDTGMPWEASWSVRASRLQWACSSVPSGSQDSANDTHSLPGLPQNPSCMSQPLGFSFSSSYCCCELLGGLSWLHPGGPPTMPGLSRDLPVDTEAGAALRTTCSAWERGRALPCGTQLCAEGDWRLKMHFCSVPGHGLSGTDLVAPGAALLALPPSRHIPWGSHAHVSLNHANSRKFRQKQAPLSSPFRVSPRMWWRERPSPRPAGGSVLRHPHSNPSPCTHARQGQTVRRPPTVLTFKLISH